MLAYLDFYRCNNRIYTGEIFGEYELKYREIRVQSRYTIIYRRLLFHFQRPDSTEMKMNTTVLYHHIDVKEKS